MNGTPAPATDEGRRHWLTGSLLATVTALIALAFGWLALQIRSLQHELDLIRSEQRATRLERQALQARGRELEAEAGRRQTETAGLRLQLAEREEQIDELERRISQSRRSAAPMVVSMVLSAGVRSVDAAAALALAAAVDVVELYVDLEGDDGYGSFRATLETVTGAQLWGRAGIAARVTDWGNQVVVEVPAKLLSEGAYELTVEGLDPSGEFEPVGFYGFNVARQE